MHGNIKNNSYIETHKEYLIDINSYNTFKSNFDFIDNTSFINTYLYKLISNNINLIDYCSNFSNNKSFEKLKSCNYLISYKNLIYVNIFKPHQISFNSIYI